MIKAPEGAARYTAAVEITGEGRNGGVVRAMDGRLEHRLAVPKELGGVGGATNPEQLFAAGWGGCFLTALRAAAAQRGIRPTGSEITVEVTLHHGEDGDLSLSAVLTPRLSGVDQQTAEELAAIAHRNCPYSRATRGNISVVVNACAM
ncbi:Ohr family peroxiredoxin [Catenulispora subtropica]|uniref:Organic hydroperoxide resistance protein n=1 Tax=Catenulispora subtropica TaxID=450798 RepID=A0ABP5DNQ8_9ACTN